MQQKKDTPTETVDFARFENWRNRDNAQFYEHAPLASFAKKAGMDSCPDLELIKDKIVQAKSILELGAGYGRVIQFIQHVNPEASITAIERAPKFCKLLRKRFGQSITLIEGDLLEVDVAERFDLVLWMWSGISDFAPEEQVKAFRTYSNLLRKQGDFVIEANAFKSTATSNATHEHGGKVFIFHGETPYCGYKSALDNTFSLHQSLSRQQFMTKTNNIRTLSDYVKLN